MTLEIISPNEILFKGEAEAVTMPGALGSFTVLKNHASPDLGVKGGLGAVSHSGRRGNQCGNRRWAGRR